jgi:hypothetical protein
MDGLKGAKANVERELTDFCTAPPDFFEDLWSEMKAGGRRSNGAGAFGINSLIAFAI